MLFFLFFFYHFLPSTKVSEMNNPCLRRLKNQIRDHVQHKTIFQPSKRGEIQYTLNQTQAIGKMAALETSFLYLHKMEGVQIETKNSNLQRVNK